MCLDTPSYPRRMWRIGLMGLLLSITHGKAASSHIAYSGQPEDQETRVYPLPGHGSGSDAPLSRLLTHCYF